MNEKTQFIEAGSVCRAADGMVQAGGSGREGLHARPGARAARAGWVHRRAIYTLGLVGAATVIAIAGTFARTDCQRLAADQGSESGVRQEPFADSGSAVRALPD